jgi:inhibitor of KinA
MTLATTGPVTFQPASDQSLLVYFGTEITLAAHHKLRSLLRALQAQPIAGVRNLHPAYCSLLIDFDLSRLTHSGLEALIEPLLRSIARIDLPEPRLIEIPTQYGGEFGPDLDELAAIHGLSPAQAVELHASVAYVVYFLGFVPGFAYLGELPDALATPRLATPRRTVPPGSVGIADTQTAVYPLATPGGWRLIGRTPMAMFRPDADDLSLLRVGDRVRFRPRSPAEFAAFRAP